MAIPLFMRFSSDCDRAAPKGPQSFKDAAGLEGKANLIRRCSLGKREKRYANRLRSGEEELEALELRLSSN